VTGAASVVRYCNLSTSRASASHCWLSRRLKAITLCLLAFRLWPARGGAQGRGLRFGALTGSRVLPDGAPLPGRWKNTAPGPLRFAAFAGRDLQCQKAKKRAATPQTER
jgi:hypothetical protein